MQRRKFMQGAAVAGAGVVGGLLAGCQKNDEPAGGGTAKTAKFDWKLVTTWPPNFPIFQEGVLRLANDLRSMSNGRLNIQVFAGGELVPALETFSAVSQGTVQMGHGAGYYWAGKIPAAQFFTAVPFGMNAMGMIAWMHAGGGLELYREVYKPYNLVPFPMGNTGVQMGGWFKKKITSLADLKGLKMRIPGLGGKVMAKAGVNPVLYPAGDIAPALERGTLDAAEWVGPFHDVRLGLQRAAQNYYYPGWHEPGPMLELLINRAAWDSLPTDLQAMVSATAAATSLWMLAEFEARNQQALGALLAEHKITIQTFPPDVLRGLRQFTEEVLNEEAAKDVTFKKVYEAYSAFQKEHEAWSRVSEEAYAQSIKR